MTALDLLHPKTGGKPVMSEFAAPIYKHKYSLDGKEEWEDTSRRVVENVMGPYLPELVEETIAAIKGFKFMPGGRFLYAAGKRLHQTNNCFSGDTRFLTDQGVRSLREIANLPDNKVRVRNRFGRWENARVEYFGEQELLEVGFGNNSVVNVTADHRWWQTDGTRKTTMEIEQVPLSIPAEYPEMDIEGIRHGVIFGDGHIRANHSEIIFVNPEKDQHLVSYFENEERKVTVGFGAVISVNTIREVKAGTKISLQPIHYKSLPNTYTPEYARGFIAGLIATDGCANKGGSVTIAQEGLAKARAISEIAMVAGCVVNSVRVVNRVNPFSGAERELCVISIKPGSAPLILPSHIEKRREVRASIRKIEIPVEYVQETGRVESVYCVVAPETESFTLANGLITSNCFLFRAGDSREELAQLMSDVTNVFMTGGGAGIVWSDLRARGALVKGMGGTSTGPTSFMQMVNEIGRGIVQGGSRRASIWAGLHWNHPDIFEFISLKDWAPGIVAAKAEDYNAVAPLDMTNISVILDDDFFTAYEAHDPLAHKVYWTVVEKMLTTGEPGFSVDVGENAGENLRNPCCEITSSDNADICCLGSVNMAQVDTIGEFERLVELGTAFLLCGTLYSDVPMEAVKATRTKNRRLGLGVMGVYEWLMLRGYGYEQNEELAEWLESYRAYSDWYARLYAKQLGVSIPVKVRAIAPNGTIGILAGTTTSIEPLFAVAMKRRYLKGSTLHYQYVIDATAQRMIEKGIDPARLETAYDMANNPEKRIAFQAFVQRYVDQGISSTLNLPAPSQQSFTPAEFGAVLIRYLPQLRGITAYPDGARGGQPLTVVPYEEADGFTGYEYEEWGNDQACVSGVCGT